MNILFVTPYLASPPRCGAQRRLEGLMQGLSVRHQVTLLSYTSPDDIQPEALHPYCTRLITIQHDVLGMGAANKRLLQLRSMASRHSFEYLLYRDERLQQRLDRLILDNEFDVVQIEFAQMGIFRLPGQGARRPRFVLDEHNIEYEIVKRTAEAEGSVMRRGYSALNWRKVRSEELDAWRRFDGVALTSSRDQELLVSDNPNVPTAVVPNAVDLEAFRPNETAIEPGTLLFLGALDYHPNTEGIQYFLDEIWPLIVSRRHHTKLVVVGRNPPSSLLARQSSQVQFTGYVDDPRVNLDRAAVVIVPLRIGGGTRFKIIEAMAKGKPLVSTRIGAEGLDAEHEKHLLLADDPGTFAAETCRLLDDQNLAARLGTEARRFAESKYGWLSAVQKLEQFYEQLQRKE